MTETVYADCCSTAVAVHEYVKGEQMLALCGHHSGKSQARLAAEGWAVMDASVPTDTVMADVQGLWRDDQWKF